MKLRSLLRQLCSRALGVSQSSRSNEERLQWMKDRSSLETLRLEVLAVLMAAEADKIFRAYLANWKGQDVIVSDTVCRVDCKAGDIIDVLIVKSLHPGGESKPGLLSFQVFPQRRP